jgi:hypothetical protein
VITVAASDPILLAVAHGGPRVDIARGSQWCRAADGVEATLRHFTDGDASPRAFRLALALALVSDA